MRWWARSVVVALMALAGAMALDRGAARAVITDLSNDRIEIRYSFRGADLILFGAFGDTRLDDPQTGDVVVVVRGPELPTTVRRKGEVGGIWINQDEIHFPAAPGYYAVASTRPLEEIAAPDVFRQAGIGFHNLRLAIRGGPGTEAQKPAFRDALYRLGTRDGLYRQGRDRVHLLGEGLFRTSVTLPSNVPVGRFQVEAFIFEQGTMKARHGIELTVYKEGFERAVFAFAHDRPFLYGVTAVIIALFAGWLASAVRRRR
ncbi:TIGR02186 family protein [Yunchengibacter salinarum]|uniref:TIGR02186 family protein n=1 Tax=Yunchengibacter salinarum TaxID=3133399 RepID=UPI0035B61B9C